MILSIHLVLCKERPCCILNYIKVYGCIAEDLNPGGGDFTIWLAVISIGSILKTPWTWISTTVTMIDLFTLNSMIKNTPNYCYLPLRGRSFYIYITVSFFKIISHLLMCVLKYLIFSTKKKKKTTIIPIMLFTIYFYTK